MSTTRLRVLIVEDVAEDAELIGSQLLRSGFDVDWTRVDAPSPLRAALTRPGWDLILTDYSLPTLSVSTVLQLIREQQLTVPCVLVSGTASEETARASFKLGMTDFVSKHNLSELGPVVARVLRGARRLGVSLRNPRLRLTSGHELDVVEWSRDSRVVDGETPLRPESQRDGLLLQEQEATRVRVHVLECHIQILTADSVVYRSLLAVLGH